MTAANVVYRLGPRYVGVPDSLRGRSCARSTLVVTENRGMIKTKEIHCSRVWNSLIRATRNVAGETNGESISAEEKGTS